MRKSPVLAPSSGDGNQAGGGMPASEELVTREHLAWTEPFTATPM
jgi:hypothetical protein